MEQTGQKQADVDAFAVEHSALLDRHFPGRWGLSPFDEKLPRLAAHSAGRLPEKPTGVISAVFPYYSKEAGGGDLSVYCAVPDYHKIVLAALEAAAVELRAQFPQNAFVPFCDAAPFGEVMAAARAGLGCIGENGLLITPRWGSWVFLGELVTDLPLPVSAAEPAPCLRCGACQRACPGGALPGDSQVLTPRCASFIGQKKGALSPEEEEILRCSGYVFGCDICQTVCPMNQDKAPGLSVFGSDIIKNWRHFPLDGDIKQRAFGWRGAAVPARNAAILYNENTIDKKEETP